MTMEAALDGLHLSVETACAAVQRRGESLSLEETTEVMESAVVVLDAVLAIVRTTVARTEMIRERELTERRGSSALDVLDQAVLHLGYGREVVEGGRHLLGMGWGEVLRVTRGEV
ncbi:hypothetical protein ACQEU6_15840 [Spirillospora sp. CA-108201]